MGIFRLFGIICLAVLIEGCAVTPKISDPTQASFSGNSQNSGIFRKITTVSPDGDKEDIGWEVDSVAIDRYNAFIGYYGSSLMPPIKKNFGVSPMLGTDHFLMTDEALDCWNRMIILRDRNRINHAGTLESKIGL